MRTAGGKLRRTPETFWESLPRVDPFGILEAA